MPPLDRREVLALGAAALSLPLSAPKAHAAAPSASVPRNVLLIDVDDLGWPFLESALASGFAPNLAALRPSAREFQRFWAAPICSVFRARMLTGLDPYRPGNLVGANVPSHGLTTLFPGPSGKWITHDMPGRRTKRGKFHLAAGLPSPWPECIVELSAARDGYDESSGSKGNLSPGYTDWTRGEIVRGGTATIATTTTHATNDTYQSVLADLALGTEFVHASFNAIHFPLESPPTNEPPGAVYSGGTPDDIRREILFHLDWRLGELIQTAIGSGYVVMLACDNGTAGSGKGTMYEIGVRTPFFVWGWGVAPGKSRRLVSATDLWSTVRWLRGCADWTSAADSSNFADAFLRDQLPLAPPRQILTVDQFPGYAAPPDPQHWQRAIRDARYKLIDTPDAAPPDPVREFFDLNVDPGEQNNLLLGSMSTAQQVAYNTLLALLP